MISGTSHDGIDCAVVDFQYRDGVLDARLERTRSVPYSDALRSDLIAALPPAAVTLREVTQLDTRIGQEFAAAAAEIALGLDVDVICSHGQTVYHWVDDGVALGTTAARPAGVDHRGDRAARHLRRRAPAMSRPGDRARRSCRCSTCSCSRGSPACGAALNLGGISNATILRDGSDPVAWDLGPANALIDAAVRMTGASPEGFDRGERSLRRARWTTPCSPTC